MTRPRMPVTLPSADDAEEFRFVAIAEAGSTWRWNEAEGVWVLMTGSTRPRSADTWTQGARKSPWGRIQTG